VQKLYAVGRLTRARTVGGRQIHEANRKLNEFNLTEVPLQAATQV